MSLLEVHGLSKSFGAVRALDDVSFDLPAGQLLALLGPNGAGKSTCFNILNGQVRPDAGSVHVDGRMVSTARGGMSSRAIWRLGVGRTFQVSATFSSMTVAENVQMALISHQRMVFRLWRAAASMQRDEAMALLEQVGMAAQADRPCGVLAYGDVKRVELAMALANRPRLLLMDEPTAGMAPGERHALMALTRQLVTRHNVAVLFTEHSMDVVFAHADRMIVMARGRIIAEGDGDTIRRHPQVQAVYLGSGKSFQLPEAPAP